MGDIILFIDEMHTLIGAGSAEGSIDAAAILKPPLSRGEIQVIGATTIDEYRKHLEKDSALERRFQPITVGEPNEEQAMRIMEGLRDRYEAHHQVHFTDEALQAAVNLSNRYIQDRFPVSYTHLDVYKRQGMGNIPFLHRHVTLAASGGARSQKRFARAIWRLSLIHIYAHPQGKQWGQLRSGQSRGSQGRRQELDRRQVRRPCPVLRDQVRCV